MVRLRLDFTGRGPVVFEGVVLPDEAKGFERLPFWEELTPAVQEWLLDLHYCWGRVRELPSDRVLRGVREVRRQLARDVPGLTARLRTAFPQVNDAEIEASLRRFGQTLDLIETATRQTQVCRWTVEPSEADLERNLTLAIRLVRDGLRDEFAPLDSNPPPGFEFRVRTAPRAKQLAWLADVSDALTVPRPGRLGRAWEQLQNRFRRFLDPV